MNYQSDENMTDTVPRAALEFVGIGHAYGNQTSVSDLSLQIAPGEIVCLLGPSGCGKSTTLRIAAGIETPLAGRVIIDGECVADDAVFVPPEKRHAGLVFQDYALFPHLTVLDNVMFGLEDIAKDQRKARAMKTLEQVGMAQYANKYPSALSGGEQQRVALARALAPRPHIMLMDEPFSGLDRSLRDRVRHETRDIMKAENAATLLVTHDPEEALLMADKIALMRKSRIVQLATPDEIYHQPVDLAAAAFFSDITVLKGSSSGTRVETPLGDLTGGTYPVSTEVTVGARPQHVLMKPDAEGNARISMVRMLGDKTLVEANLTDDEGQVIKSYQPPNFQGKVGDQVQVSLDADQVFVFEGTQSL